MKKLIQYSIIDLKPNIIDYEIINYTNSKGLLRRADLLMRSVKHRGICKKYEIDTVKFNIFKGNLFMYYNTEEKLSKHEVYSIFYKKYEEILKLGRDIKNMKIGVEL